MLVRKEFGGKSNEVAFRRGSRKRCRNGGSETVSPRPGQHGRKQRGHKHSIEASPQKVAGIFLLTDCKPAVDSTDADTVVTIVRVVKVCQLSRL
jgi:hypothetical protein